MCQSNACTANVLHLNGLLSDRTYYWASRECHSDMKSANIASPSEKESMIADRKANNQEWGMENGELKNERENDEGGTLGDACVQRKIAMK